MTVRVVQERRQPGLVDTRIDMQRHKRFLLGPGDDVHRQFDDLLRCEGREHVRAQAFADLTRHDHECIGESESNLLSFRQVAALVGVDLVERCFFRRQLPGNCQADGESGAAVVVASAPKSNELRGF
jgi:hypothetical protein